MTREAAQSSRDDLFVVSNARDFLPFSSVAQRVSSKSDFVSVAKLRAARWLIRSPVIQKVLVLSAPRPKHRVLVLDPVMLLSRSVLSHVFPQALFAEGLTLLPSNELSSVLSDEHPEDYFIGGGVAEKYGQVILIQGDLRELIVPCAWFKPSGTGLKPDFRDFEITDYGGVIRLGEYEVASDAILYEYDKDARRRMKARRVNLDRSLGGSLLRLRTLKGLQRSDFGDVSAKTIARIERGETENPHPGTMAKIARLLGVRPDEIIGY